MGATKVYTRRVHVSVDIVANYIAIFLLKYNNICVKAALCSLEVLNINCAIGNVNKNVDSKLYQ